MSIKEKLQERANNTCELCQSADQISVYGVPPESQLTIDDSILICIKCHNQIEEKEPVEPNHWRLLNDSMWSEVDAIKVVSWRMLQRLKSEGWSQDLLEMMYMEDETLSWARATGEGSDIAKIVHKDANGVTLASGDNVVLIKDLNVKGAGFTAKRGTAVRRISLVNDNTEHIEGKVNGQQIVILTQYVKKT